MYRFDHRFTLSWNRRIFNTKQQLPLRCALDAAGGATVLFSLAVLEPGSRFWFCFPYLSRHMCVDKFGLYVSDPQLPKTCLLKWNEYRTRDSMFDVRSSMQTNWTERVDVSAIKTSIPFFKAIDFIETMYMSTNIQMYIRDFYSRTD